MTIQSAKTAVFLASLVFLLCGLTASGLAEGSLRYLDVETGADTPDCLSRNASSQPSQPCRTLWYALGDPQPLVDLQVLVWPGSYAYGNDAIVVTNASNVLIMKAPESVGDVLFECSYPSEDYFNNLAVIGGQNFTIRGITFENCGSWSAALYFGYINGILVSNCTFRHNSGSGMYFYRSTNIWIEDSIFEDNIGMRQDALANVTSFNFRTFSSGGMALLFDNSTNPLATITGCTFRNNLASVNERNIDDPRPPAYKPFGDGGAMTIRLANYTENGRITVTNCSFVGNSAKSSGGTIYVPVILHSKNNSVLVSDCIFESSLAQATGGAISFDVFDVEENNTVTLVNNVFRNCSAWFGGGSISIILEDSLASAIRIPTSNRNFATLRNCTFENNFSQMGGSAIGLVSNARVDQSSFSTILIDCTFTGNRAISQSAVLAFRFPVIFEGHTVFSDNVGGCISLLQSLMDSAGVILFHNNTANEGGAITIENQGMINLHRGTSMNFIGNRAETVGGAILVRDPTVVEDIRLGVYNTLCFIQYEIEKDRQAALPPGEWEGVNVTFINNTAMHAGAAIYASDLTRCIFTTVDCQIDDSSLTEYEKSIFTESPPFYFRGNRVLEKDPLLEGYIHDVGTEPYQLMVALERRIGAPGDRLRLQIEAHDQSGNLREAIWSKDDENFRLEGYIRYFVVPDAPLVRRLLIRAEDFSYESCNSDEPEVMETAIQEPQDIQFYIIQALTGEITNGVRLEVALTCCHPGYYYDTTNQTCVFNSDFPHFLRPDNDNRHVFLQPGYYAGFYHDTDRGETYFTTSIIPSVFQNCMTEGTRTGCHYTYDKPDMQCVDDRTGFMCGQCPEGYGVDLTLRKCKKCTIGDTVGLVIICILIVVFSFLVLLFNIGVPNDMKGFLFYAQVVGFVYQNGAQDQSWDYHLSRSLGFSVYLPICPFTTLPALWTTAFGILPSILATATVVVYVISARFIRPLSQRTSFDGIWLIVLFVYKYTADTVANILKCVQLEGDAVDRQHFLKLAFFYDGSVPCFSGDHLILAIPALLLLVLVVFIAPVFITLVSFKRFKITQPFTDVITDGINTKYRWWSAFDLLRRLLIIAVITIFDFVLPEYAQLALCFTILAVLGILCTIKPYVISWVNVVEAAILLDLLLIAFHFLNAREFGPVRTPYLAVVLLLLPFVYALVNISIRIAFIVWKKYIPVSPLTTARHYFTRKRLHKAKSGLGEQLLQLSHSAHAGQTESYWVVGESKDNEESDPQHLTVDYSLLREELLEYVEDPV